MSDIKYAYPLILNKVASPQYATPVLRRERLLDWLNEAANCRATVIAADAGYGKTTLMWQWEREVAFPCYWYKLDRTDRDWTFHISYLIEAISKRHRGFGRRAHSMLQQMGGPGTARPGVAAYLLAEMHQRLTEPCTFIIDDWQYVNAVTEVRGLWNQILRDAPATCRFVFASRVKPKLQFARFKTHGGYAELQTDALRFTEPEIAELFRDVYNDPLDASELAELDRRTEGWAASLQLVEVSLRERVTPDERSNFIRSITATRDSDLFQFLAEEVLDQQSEGTRNFLLSTSILHQITPEVAERLTGVHDGHASLIDLEHRGLFTARLDEVRFRYHNLFRDFLERRLAAERSEAEITGLHIHAASYFETSEQWPEAIHHYLRAHLQRQAARLIAKNGEDVVASGGLGFVDEWLRELTPESVRQNARLSLLAGEADGVRGAWQTAVESLERARVYFARKGDRRMEALACLKLSTVHYNSGDIEQAVAAADAGAELLPPDAVATRLRLQGNLTLARTWMNAPLSAVVAECEEIASEADKLGLEHISAIAHHNAGGALLRMGKISRAITSLTRAAGYWSEPPASPFADNALLVLALLANGDAQEARSVARQAVRRTEPWPRPHSHARYGEAAVLAFEGRLEAAIDVLRAIRTNQSVVGATQAMVDALLIECMYLCAASSQDIAVVARDLPKSIDARHESDIAPAAAIVRHVSGSCNGACQRSLETLKRAEGRGEELSVLTGRLKVGVLALEHRSLRSKANAWAAANQAVSAGLHDLVRPWLRRLSSPQSLLDAGRIPESTEFVTKVARLDPDTWRSPLVTLLGSAVPGRRGELLTALAAVANRSTTEMLGGIPGDDVVALRRRLHEAQAIRLHVRTLGRVSVQRGGWDGPEVRIEKKRIRALLGLLAATVREPISRDSVIDFLWPDADGDSAVNSLNQTVFQLRRHLDPDYRAGESPEYIVSGADHVALSEELVRVDLYELHRISAKLADADWPARRRLAATMVDLVAGEFLGDLRYEDWAGRLQLTVHSQIRGLLLPIAQAADVEFDSLTRAKAATALLRLDPYDEGAVMALADAMTASGQRAAARAMIVAHVERIRRELDDEPSEELSAAVRGISAPTQSIHA